MLLWDDPVLPYICLRKTLRHLSKPSGLVRNVGWLLGTEVTAKATRVVTILAMTFYLGIQEYGAVVLALVFHDFGRLIMRCGAGFQIIRAPESTLKAYCGNGLTLQWLLCAALSLLQYLLAEPLAALYGMAVIQQVLEGTAGVFLLYPLVSVRVFLLQRAQQMRQFSICNCVCIAAENLSLAMLLFTDLGVQAVIVSKWVFAGTWVALFSFAPASQTGAQFNLHLIGRLFVSSCHLITNETLKLLKLHSDTVVAGKLLAPEVFGLYSFAKSAGIGLSQSLSNAFTAALYPHLCEKWRALDPNQKLPEPLALTALISCLFLAQALGALIYVPLLFGPKWHPATHWVAMLCLSAIPTLFLDARCCLYRAEQRLRREMWLRGCTLLTACLGFSGLMLSGFASAYGVIAVVCFSNMAWWFCSPWQGFIPSSVRLSISIRNNSV